MTQAQAPVQGWKKYINKNFFAILGNATLALASVYLIGPWVTHVAALSALPMFLNFGVLFLTAFMLFVAKNHYSKGGKNVGKKIVSVLFLLFAIMGFSIVGLETESDILVPLAGMFIAGVTFYMISLSSQTLGIVGMSILAALLLTPIATGLWFGSILFPTAQTLFQLSMLAILAAGGVFAKIRRYLHGIQGINNDGGFGTDDNVGDEGDGDGDTEGEE